MLTHYDNIVFDLGGVLLDIDRDECVRNLQSIGITDADAMLDLYKQTGDFLALEEGKMSVGEFFDLLREKCRPEVNDAVITQALNSFIIDLPPHRLDALATLRAEGKKLYALSNTNPVMFPTRIKELFRQRELQIDDYFDGLVLSYREGVCKPESLIYRHLLERYGLDPEKTLFIDDSATNCHAAEELGIHTLLLPPGAEFTDLIQLID